MSPLDQLRKNMNHSLACAGIDPDPKKILGSDGDNKEEVIFKYLTNYINQVAPHICSFKVQKAFFDLHSGGHDLLKQTVKYIHDKYPNIPVILDCKIGDIDNTMSSYLTNVFDNLKCDGVLVNPYMGDDIFKETAKYPDKIIGVLAKTSNSGAEIIQDQLLENGNPLWIHILELAMTRWNTAGNIVPIISSTEDISLLVRARQIIPQDTPILFAGVGAQGRNENTVKYLLNDKKSGVFVNSSRALMYPATNKGQTLEQAQEKAVLELKDKLDLLKKNKLSISSHFLFVGGVSGVGKTTIMNELKKLDKRFSYIPPETTRLLRPEETDKKHISLSEMNKKEEQGEYLTVNEINGIHYGTPKKPIRDAFNQQAFPMLDFPIGRHDLIKEYTNDRIYTVYLKPPSLEELYNRLSYDGRDATGERFLSAKKELEDYNKGKFSSIIDTDLVSETGKAKEVARNIYSDFINHITKNI